MATSLDLAIAAIRSGRKEEGRQLLNLLIQQNPNNEMAWLWMSSVVTSDEQRARCLYHVLAINPNSEIARRGLQMLGIVVSDSRPVKVPRDSQPIQIPKPTPQPQAIPVEERRPFRIDPKTITDELPFTPIRPPLAPAPPESLTLTSASGKTPVTGPENVFPVAPGVSQPVAPANQPPQLPLRAPMAGPTKSTRLQELSKLLNDASQPGTAVGEARGSNEAQKGDSAAQPPASATPGPGQQAQTDTNPMPEPSPPQGAAPQSSPPNHELPNQPAYQGGMSPGQQTFPNPMAGQDTRPSQPIWGPYSNPAMGMPLPPQNQQQYPVQPGPFNQANVTMAMPTPYLQPQYVAVPIHSNPTMGMPLPPQNGVAPHPSEPIPVIHSNTTMGMAVYTPQFQPILPQNPGIHSNSTMLMPTMTEVEARARFLANQATNLNANMPSPALARQADLADYQRAAARRSPGPKPQDENEGEEVNILMVIIFGTLSITAFGGLGMLLLLAFTSG